jgi:hypothetical protein
MNWPLSDRDTTEFPDLSINVEVDLRDHLKTITELKNGVGATDYDEIRETGFEGVSDSRIRTYRKLYERLGIIYKKDGKIYRSKLGTQISYLEKNVDASAKAEVRGIAETVVKVLKRYQYINPLDAIAANYTRLPRVHPYFLLWKAMDRLDGKIHYQEINRVLAKVDSDDGIEEAIEKIVKARKALDENYNSVASIDSELGGEVVTDQASARIASLYSLAGWGGLLIDSTQDKDGFRHLSKTTREIIKTAIQTEPEFFETQDKDEWIAYYFSDIVDEDGFEAPAELQIDLKTIDVNEIISRIERLGGHYDASTIKQLHLGLTFHPTKHFVMLKGPSGTGKTLLVRAYTRALFDVGSLDIHLPNLFMCPVRPNWTDPSQVVGYFDVISGKYVVPNVLEAILTALKSPDVPIFICFDEMNLSRIEYYFSDVLSAMESREEFELHSRGENAVCAQGRHIPEKIALPKNIYIIGTINVDESTSPISEKVLDRAAIVDLNGGDLERYLDFLERTEPSVRTLIGKLRPFLLELDKTLNSGGRGLNNRSVEELILYLQRVNESSNLEVDDHIDEVIRSKIIAKLKGDENSRDMVDELVALLESDKCPTMLTASLKVARELRSQLNDFGAFKAFR